MIYVEYIIKKETHRSTFMGNNTKKYKKHKKVNINKTYRFSITLVII